MIYMLLVKKKQSLLLINKKRVKNATKYMCILCPAVALLHDNLWQTVLLNI